MSPLDKGDNDDSQSSQLLKAMLNPQNSLRSPSVPRRLGQPKDSNTTQGSTTDSSPSRTSNSLPNFDLHGLGQTQTQRLDGELDFNEGSQKENIGAGAEEVSKLPPMSILNPPHAAPSASGITKKNAAPSSLSSPQRVASELLGGTTLTAQKSGSPISPQDSFAVLDEDPGQQSSPFSKQFNVPLSDLTKLLPSRVDVSPSRTSSGSMYSAYSRRHSRRSMSPPEGKVLVESTPSVSGGSQSQSQSFQEAQPFEAAIDLPQDDHEADQAEISSRVEEVAQEPIEYLSDCPSNFYAEQTSQDTSFPPTDRAPTQPSTQVDDVYGMDVDTHPFDAPAHESAGYTANTSSFATTTNPRSLLAMVDPKKRYRYQHLAQQNPGRVTVESPQVHAGNDQMFMLTQTNSPPTTGELAPSELLVETQPSVDEPFYRPQRGFPVRSKPSSAVPFPHHCEVIPDSEPRQEDITESRIASRGRNNTATSSRRPENVVNDMNTSETRSAVEVANTLFPEGEEEEEEEEEENVPLMARSDGKRLNKLNSNGKGKAIVTPIKETDDTAALQEKERPVAKQNQRTSRTRSTASESWKSGIIPSSIPNEDAGKNKVPVTRKAAASAKAHMESKSRRSERTGRRVEKNVESDELSASDDEIGLKAGGYIRQDARPTNEQNVDPNVPEPSSRKRKPSNPPAQAPNARSRAKKPRIAASLGSITRQTSNSNRSHSPPSPPTRVFALWAGDGHFYAGTVYSDRGNGLYEIAFDDATNAEADIDSMRSLDLRVGDRVMVPDLMDSFKVTDVNDLASGVVGVSVYKENQKQSLESLKITAETIRTAWQGRTLDRDDIIPIVKSEPGRSFPPASRSGGTRPLNEYAFVVSFTLKKSSRDTILDKLQHLGGVVKDWSDVISLKGRYSNQHNRWVIERSEARWIGDATIKRIFFLGNEASYKPKFLLALALGVPCLHYGWLDKLFSRSGSPGFWSSYLLDQGHSSQLNARISQQVNMDWGKSARHLTDIMDNNVPCKLLNGKSVLCVGYVVPKMNSKKLSMHDQNTQNNYDAITRIILAMGAERVEAVSGLRHASRPLHEFDYVVVKDDQNISELDTGPHCRTMTWTWLKECLIASRFFSEPENEIESQEV
ncbi:hypothetical protein H0H93_011902 [Arthromyces matolae]|nr:hypothetical protein H0H93_011902 [Arthromyces matolae]